jgi:hypothetical protein
LGNNAYSINNEARCPWEDDDSDEEQKANNRLSHENLQDDQQEANLEYRELRDKNSVIFRNF